MPAQNFFKKLEGELGRIGENGSPKRNERIIEGFVHDTSPRALIEGKPYLVFNSNDYLGLRLHPKLRGAEHEASLRSGVGPGAVRFISGTLAIHRELEKDLALFHCREDAMLFSSAFAANLGLLSVLCKGEDVLVISDELNHRSIIDGIRLSGVGSAQKTVFKHRDCDDLERVLEEGKDKFARVVIVTDGVFSMLGVTQDLRRVRAIVDVYNKIYPDGVLLVVDDCHGIGVLGNTGRGAEEFYAVKADVLVGTLGKALGVDGGYVVGDKLVLDYLRENASTYIYSNPVSPGVAGAGCAAIKLLDSNEGQLLFETLRARIALFKTLAREHGLNLASESDHAVQPLLVGDTLRARKLAEDLFSRGILVTPITYPVVPKGKDEIRLQLSAAHSEADVSVLIDALSIR